MSWNLKGSYVETCSCDLICPCNALIRPWRDLRFLSRDARLQHSRRQIEGTDISGLGSQQSPTRRR